MGESEPRQLNIQVPPWLLLLPIAALGFYYFSVEGSPLGPPVSS